MLEVEPPRWCAALAQLPTLRMLGMLSNAAFSATHRSPDAIVVALTVCLPCRLSVEAVYTT